MISRREALSHGAALLSTAFLPSLASGATRAQTGMPPGGQIRLANGRCLKYYSFGNPSGPLVFYFHGTPGAAIEAGLIEDEAAVAGVHLVAIDRPGIGLSSYYAGRRVVDWPADVECVANALGYRGSSFGVIGMSGGTPYATACARLIPHRLTHVAVVSGHSQLGAPSVTAGNVDNVISLVTRHPSVSRLGIGFIYHRLDRKPDKVVQKITKNWGTADRELILCNPRYYNDFIAVLREATRCGVEGLVTDVRLLACNWGFELCQIQGVSVSIWQGGCDSIAPPSTGRYFHNQIAGSEYHFDPKAGHVTMLKWHAPEIFARYHSP